MDLFWVHLADQKMKRRFDILQVVQTIKSAIKRGSYNVSLWNSNTTQSMLSLLKNSGPKVHRGMLLRIGD